MKFLTCKYSSVTVQLVSLTQAMPFLLRRTKEEVLTDLPPKIIQDRMVDLSPLQVKLYEDFSRSDVRHEVSSLVQGADAATAVPEQATTHVFQALQVGTV